MSEQLQTDPYLSLVPPRGECPVVFATDEDPLLRPALAPPPDAVFGVIGLDRAIVWCADREVAKILEAAATRPVLRAALEQTFEPRTVQRLIECGWLQPPENLCRAFMLTSAQIEVTVSCNWSCRCCPVSQFKKPRAVMPLALYERVIDKLAAVDTLRYVTHHFYNEPTLDPHFTERLDVIRRAGMRFRLFTNGSGLNDQKIRALWATGVLDFVVFNLPSSEPGAFAEFTQSRSYQTSFRNLEAAVAHGLDVRIAVNGLGAPVQQTVSALREKYGPKGVRVFASLISDRAAALQNEFSNDVYVTGPLTGCSWPVNHLHIGVEGELFLCCNDYFKREVFGHIDDGPVHGAMSSDAAVALRRKVFGVAGAEADFICRRCHDQCADFPLKQFKPIARFPIELLSTGATPS